MHQTPVEVAIAILYQKNHFLMQLRDNNPNIVYPGHWAFFGGHLEAGENPATAVRRELQEEIGYAPPQLLPFGRYDCDIAIRHVFAGKLQVDVADLVLNEGWDLALLSPEQIRQGKAYSHRAGYACPLGSPHQQILLDFMTQVLQLDTAESS